MDLLMQLSSSPSTISFREASDVEEEFDARVGRWWRLVGSFSLHRHNINIIIMFWWRRKRRRRSEEVLMKFSTVLR
jgi:hypothetical protein